MDNSWRVKFDSTLQSSMLPVASSASQEPRDQVEINSGQYCRQHAAQDLSSTLHDRMHGIMPPNYSNLCSHKPNHSDLANSFLELLSGPPSLLQYDFQELSSQKVFNASRSVNINDFASEIPRTNGTLLSENVSNQNTQNEANYSAVPSRLVLSSTSSSFSVLHCNLHASNLNLQNSDLAKVVNHHMLPGTEKITDFATLKGDCHATGTAKAGNPHCKNIQMLMKIPEESNSSISDQSSTLLSGCPRVFCFGTGGYLLLSNTGLLGIICSCHFFHTSVSKFCEHLGLCDINPGDAVRMESGETIAQWRKLYFEKFGIRVPEDHSGWDWPEGLLPTTGLVKSSATMPKISSTSHVANPVGSSQGLSRCVDNSLCPNIVHGDQNSAIGLLHNKHERKNEVNNNFLLKRLFGASRNLHDTAEGQRTECAFPKSSTMSTFVGRDSDNGCQSMSTWIDSILKPGNSSHIHSSLQNLRTLGGNCHAIAAKITDDGVVSDRDAASSNVELKLGQPYQPNQPIGNSALPVIAPENFNTVVDPCKSCYSEKMVEHATFCGEDEFGQYRCQDEDASNPTARRQRSLLSFSNHAFASSSLADAAKPESRGDATKSLLVPLLPELPLEGSACSGGTNNMVREFSMPKIFHCGSNAIKCDPLNEPLKIGNNLGRQLNMPELGFCRLTEKGKGAGLGCVPGGFSAAIDPALRIQKQVENSRIVTGVVPGFSVAHDMNSCQSSNIPLGRFDERSCLNHHGNSFFDERGSRHVSQSSAASMGFPLTTSTSIQGSASTISQQDGPRLLDDGMRLLALRQISELSKQHSISSVGTSHERGRLHRTSSPNLQHSLLESSKSREERHGSILPSRQDVFEGASPSFPSAAEKSNPMTGLNNHCDFSRFTQGRLHRTSHAISSVGTSHERGRLHRTSSPNLQHSLLESSKSREERHGSILPSRQDVFEGASPSFPSAAEKSNPMTGLNNHCDFSRFTQGLTLDSRVIDMPRQFSNDHFRYQSTLRLGESITQLTGHAKCCQRVPCTYSRRDCICSAHAECLKRYSEGRVEGSHVVSKEQAGFCCEEPNPVASEFVRDHIIPKERTILLDQGGKVNGQLPMRIACHASQWRDVPSKQKEACEVTRINSLAEVLDASGSVEVQLGAAAGTHGIGSPVNRADTFKGQDMSNISSGCSGPAVTQASIEVNNIGSSTIDAEDNVYRNGLIVDEGSGIDKCCSSNDALESERSAEFLGVSSRNKIRNKGSSKILNGHSPISLLDELKLIDSLTWKKAQNQTYNSLTGSGRTNHLKKIRRGLKGGKRKREIKFRMLDVSFPPKVSFRHRPKDNGNHHLPSRSSKDRHTLIPSGLESHGSTQLIQPGELDSAKIVHRKRDLCDVYNDQNGEDYQLELKGDDRFGKILEVSGRKKFKGAWSDDSFENLGAPKPLRTVEKTFNSNSVHCIKAFSSLEVTVCDKKARPIVCGEYGEICSRKSATDELKPAKIVPLSRVLKNMEQCNFRKSCKPKSTPRKLKKRRPASSTACFDLSSDFKKEEENGANHVSFFHEVGGCLVEGGKKTCLGGIKKFNNKSFILENGKADRSQKRFIPDAIAYNQSNARCKEIRKRSLYELTGKGRESGSDSYPLVEIPKCMPEMKVRKGSKKTGDVECHGHRLCSINAEKGIEELRCSSSVDSDEFCSVCGRSNKDEFNCLLACSGCSIRVHQACYGVSKAPKGHWYCRPCRTSSKDIVCVLCGYGSGAMTRALRSHAFVEGLIKAWNIESECRAKSTSYSAETVLGDQSLVVGNEFGNLQCKDLGLSRTSLWKLDVQNGLNVILNSPCAISKLNVYNSVTAGVLDSSVKQWVHMVCGLWTPGTRCPNVNTMGAFDVSGVSHAGENVVCSICNRPGGSCIRCRVVDCSARFHPWCAHQKGLLQSEVEGVDNENVGFYGRCILHALHPTCESGSDPTNAKLSSPRKGESTCARTEGFKGRKQDGFWHNIYGQARRKSGCFVPQEQVNAWIHINGQKSCVQGLPKLPTSDIEYDCRKEYARYKQGKGWKHLVVYKSGIHALGLYTSRFISRGEMVVEYVGEIVGQHVADKREREYESGRKVQYKSACYFFRIDKEHIIDATRKGGIARFVNHSCLPNCVAKVISVKNEKKVVFFAERDIFPGEEITYDYNFNDEDEGKKIPCFCNSKNCRLYLN